MIDDYKEDEEEQCPCCEREYEEGEISCNYCDATTLSKNKAIKENRFIHKCICDWSKDNRYGFIPQVECPAHGMEAKRLLKKTVNYTEKKK